MSISFRTASIAACLAGASALAAAPLSNTNVDSYDVRAGTETFAALYKFTTNTALVETAEAITNMGSDTIKFYMGANASGQEGITLPSNVTNLMTEARDCPSYHKVLDMPFRHFIMWEYPLENSDEWWGSGYNTTDGAKDYSEMYGLTQYLLTNYNNSGKTFYLGHWEGDGYLSVTINGVAWATNPPPQTISGMIGWLNNRQKAVDDAKAATPHTNVFVYNYAEANRVRDAMLNAPSNNERVINYVIPYVTNLDYLSYSSYDAQNLDTNDLYTTLNYMEGKLPTNKLASVPGPRMWIGEYGWGYETPAQQEPLTRSYIQRLLGWSYQGHCLPYILFWEMYNNQTPSAGGTNYFLISPQDTNAPCYYLLNYFINDARMTVAQFLETNGSLPTDTQFSTLTSPLLNAPLSAPINLNITGPNASLLGPTVANASVTFSQGVYGADEASVWVAWGTQNGGSNPAAWQNSAFLGVNTNFNPVALSTVLTNLAPNTNYYVAFYASNASSQVWMPVTSPLSTAGLTTGNFSYRAQISFPVSTGGETLTNFPMLVQLGSNNVPGFSYSQFALPSGGDLRFTDSGGLTPLPFEINQWNPNGTSTVWVQLPSFSGSNNYVWAYWGNPSPAPALPSTNVWTSYTGVWHLEQTGFPYLDSTGQHPATSGVAPTWSTAHIGGFGVFNGTSDYLNVGPINLGPQFCLSAWVNLNPSATNIQGLFANKGGGYNSSGMAVFINSYNTADHRILLETGDGVNGTDLETAANALTFGQWHLVTVNVNEPAGTGQIYVDGTNLPLSGAVQTDFPSNSILNIGRITNNVYYFDGAIDEVRIGTGNQDNAETTVNSRQLSQPSESSPINPQPTLSPALTWPSTAGVFTLYDSTNLINWSPVTTPPTWSNGEWQYTIPTNSSTATFFRLQAH